MADPSFRLDDDDYEHYYTGELSHEDLESDPKLAYLTMFIKSPPRIVGDLYEAGSANWLRWVEMCNYIGWNANGPLKPIKYRGFIMPHSIPLGVTYSIYQEWRWRIRTKRPIRIAVVGGAGSGKTMMAVYIARVIEGMNPDGTDRFTVDQVTFERDEYIELQKNLGQGRVILAEETAYTFSGRGWYEKGQKEGIKIVETSRYLNNPLIFPVVNRNLLDKIIREYYINYIVEMIDRGVGKVFYTWHPQFTSYEKRKSKGTIYAALPGVEWARCKDKKGKPRDTCLFCPELYDKKTRRHNKDCNRNIWAQYERKRDGVIHARQMRLLDKEEEILKDKIPLIKRKMDEAKIRRHEFIRDGKYVIALICDRLSIDRLKAGHIRTLLELDYPIDA